MGAELAMTHFFLRTPWAPVCVVFHHSFLSCKPSPPLTSNPYPLRISTIKVHKGRHVEIDFEKEIKSITSQIVEKYEPEKIILFGSAARGDVGPNSDADFLIIKSQTPYYGADRIRELSHLIVRNIPVDFLVYRPEEFEKRLGMGDPFLKAILKECRVLYG